jgi:hypothetical protein
MGAFTPAASASTSPPPQRYAGEYTEPGSVANYIRKVSSSETTTPRLPEAAPANGGGVPHAAYPSALLSGGTVAMPPAADAAAAPPAAESRDAAGGGGPPDASVGDEHGALLEKSGGGRSFRRSGTFASVGAAAVAAAVLDVRLLSHPALAMARAATTVTTPARRGNPRSHA